LRNAAIGEAPAPNNLPVAARILTADLFDLVGLFYDLPDDLGQFDSLPANQVPQPYHDLLCHRHHMTVTVERFHRSSVDVRVLDRRTSGDVYSRNILLSRRSDGCIVQFGIVRMNFAAIDPQVRHEIESESIPLGQVLINHNIMREIELVGLWRVAPGPDLSRFFQLSSPVITYGRTAVIHLNSQPTIELLEIVTPVAPTDSI
jgi:chorismate-pyruvate lyase